MWLVDNRSGLMKLHQILSVAKKFTKLLQRNSLCGSEGYDKIYSFANELQTEITNDEIIRIIRDSFVEALETRFPPSVRAA